MGFFDHWHQILDIQEGCIKFIVDYLHHHCTAEIETLGENRQSPAKYPLSPAHFPEAQELYFKRTGIDERKEPDLSPAAEQELCPWASEKHGTDLVFVTDWKTANVLSMPIPTDGNPLLTNTFDLLCAELKSLRAASGAIPMIR